MTSQLSKPRRFTVSLNEEDYVKLSALGEAQRPKLSKQYLVEYAVRMLLKRAEDPQFSLQLRDPTRREGP